MFKIISICKGGGYMYCRTKPKHPKSNSKGLYPLHRVLMENKLKRLLKSDEVVHHIDHNKNNNDVKNLCVLSISEHSKLHKPTCKQVEIICDFCGNKFTEKPHVFKLRINRNKYKKIFCSLSCSAKYPFKKI